MTDDELLAAMMRRLIAKGLFVATENTLHPATQTHLSPLGLPITDQEQAVIVTIIEEGQ